MTSILFVDDEPNVLSGLRRLLHARRGEWDMRFALGGEAALAALAEQPCDVIVSDMRMPGLDGAALLTRVQREHPNVVRIVLSGHTEMEAALRAVPVAHQFLSKPCDAERLSDVIARACGLHALLRSDAVRAVVGSLDRLPSLPRVYAQLTRALADPETSLPEIARIVGQDLAMCAKVLQLANSAFFGQARHVASIERAVTVLGANMIKNLALAVGAFSAFERDGRVLDRLHEHSMATGRLAAAMLSDRRQAEDAFMAGMLHDLGKLVLVARFAEPLAAAVARARATDRPLYEAEREVCGVTHAAVGAYLVGLWGLPYPIVEAIAHHHDPATAAPRTFDVLTAVHVADAFAPRGPDEPGVGEVDEALLARLGVADRLPGWRQMAADLAQPPERGR
jgi:HD-like signal output (HDOD) protein